MQSVKSQRGVAGLPQSPASLCRSKQQFIDTVKCNATAKAGPEREKYLIERLEPVAQRINRSRLQRRQWIEEPRSRGPS